MTKTRSLALPGLVLALVLAAAACGGQAFPQASSPTTRVGRTPATPRAVLLAAVQRTSATGTAQMAMNMTMSGFGSPDTIKITGSGAMDFGHRRFAMTVSGGGGGETIEIQMRLVDGTVYIETNGKWTSTKVGAVGATTPVPTSYLDALKRLGAIVKLDGHETLRGVATTRYKGTVDLGTAMKGATGGAQTSAIDHMLDAMGLAKVPVVVWVDDAGRLRKMTFSMDMGAVLGQAVSDPSIHPVMSVTFELYDFGSPVNVVAPVGATSLASAHAIQSDLRNALTAEKVTYTDNMTYTADVPTLKQIEPSLDWGGKLKAVVGDSLATPAAVVCLSETSSGSTYTIADVASGPRAGTYYGTAPCPAKVTDATAATFGSRW